MKQPGLESPFRRNGTKQRNLTAWAPDHHYFVVALNWTIADDKELPAAADEALHSLNLFSGYGGSEGSNDSTRYGMNFYVQHLQGSEYEVLNWAEGKNEQK